MNLSKNKRIPRESIFLRFTIEAKEKYRGGCLIIVIIVSLSLYFDGLLCCFYTIYSSFLFTPFFLMWLFQLLFE